MLSNALFTGCLPYSVSFLISNAVLSEIPSQINHLPSKPLLRSTSGKTQLMRVELAASINLNHIPELKIFLMLTPVMGNKLPEDHMARSPAQSWEAMVTKGVHWL